MYSKTAKSSHYLPRMASYSTVPKRNGRVDVLPPEAKTALYSATDQIRDGEVRISKLNKEREALALELHTLSGIDRLRSSHTHQRDYRPLPEVGSAKDRIAAIDREIASVRRHIGELKALLGGASRLSIEAAFMRIAEIELPPDLYAALKSEAAMIATRKAK